MKNHLIKNIIITSIIIGNTFLWYITKPLSLNFLTFDFTKKITNSFIGFFIGIAVLTTAAIVYRKIKGESFSDIFINVVETEDHRMY